MAKYFLLLLPKLREILRAGNIMELFFGVTPNSSSGIFTGVCHLPRINARVPSEGPGIGDLGISVSGKM